MPKRIDPEVRARALRLLETHGQEYSSLTAAAAAMSKQLGVGHETVRRGSVQAQIDGGTCTGTTTDESAEIGRLKAENKQLREDVAILKAATTFFAGNSTPATDDHRLHRFPARQRFRGRVDLPGPA